MYWIATICAVGFLALLSSKTFRLVLTALKFELLYNFIGAKYLLEDILYKSKNKIEIDSRPGCVAVVTGGARGIGVEVVKTLAECNISVIIACRNTKAGEALVQKIRDDNSNIPEIEVYELDVGSLDSVRKFAKQVGNKYPKINYLINNAGIMFGPYKETVDGFESQIGINYLGHFLLTHLLLPNLRRAGLDSPYKSRIVNVTSCAHVLGDIDLTNFMMKDNYLPSAAYARSKLAQAMFTKYLNCLLQKEKAKIEVFSVHPGIVNTELFDGTPLKTVAPWLPSLVFKSPVQGSMTIVHAAIAKNLDGKGGAYLSNCQIGGEDKRVDNPQLQKELFTYTKQLCGINDKFSLLE